MIAVYGAQKGYRFAVTSFFDVIMTWNHGISYGLMRQHNVLGRLVLVRLGTAYFRPVLNAILFLLALRLIWNGVEGVSATYAAL